MLNAADDLHILDSYKEKYSKIENEIKNNKNKNRNDLSILLEIKIYTEKLLLLKIDAIKYCLENEDNVENLKYKLGLIYKLEQFYKISLKLIKNNYFLFQNDEDLKYEFTELVELLKYMMYQREEIDKITKYNNFVLSLISEDVINFSKDVFELTLSDIEEIKRS